MFEVLCVILLTALLGERSFILSGMTFNLDLVYIPL